jgi:hypothetical protein
MRKIQILRYKVFKDEFWIKKINYQIPILYRNNRYSYKNYWIAKEYFEKNFIREIKTYYYI